MSYLELPHGIPDFKQAVISFWFRVPLDSMQAAFNNFNPDTDQESPNWGWFTPPFNGVVPLISFGSVEQTTADCVLGPGLPVTPSYIGLNTTVHRGGAFADAYLAVNLQMSTEASGQTNKTSGTKRPDVFHMDAITAVEPDHWHHVLLSFDLKDCDGGFDPGDGSDLGAGYFFSTWADFWCAFDDQDFTDALFAFDPSSPASWSDAGFPGNSIISQGMVNVDLTVDSNTHWTAVPILSDVNPIGTPTVGRFVDNVYAVELAELEFFTGVTLDTSIESNRRAFIAADGTPVDPQSGSIELLGKRPEILLHGSGNWSAGKNTGPMVDNPDYDPDQPAGPNNPEFIPDPDKQFTPTGLIVPFSPDPALESSTPPPILSGEALRQRRMMASA